MILLRKPQNIFQVVDSLMTMGIDSFKILKEMVDFILTGLICFIRGFESQRIS